MKGEEDNGKWQVECKSPVVSIASMLRFFLCVRKSIKVFKKGMLSLDLSGLGPV
jgi:hypothetical protein